MEGRKYGEERKGVGERMELRFWGEKGGNGRRWIKVMSGDDRGKKRERRFWGYGCRKENLGKIRERYWKVWEDLEKG